MDKLHVPAHMDENNEKCEREFIQNEWGYSKKVEIYAQTLFSNNFAILRSNLQ